MPLVFNVTVVCCPAWFNSTTSAYVPYHLRFVPGAMQPSALSTTVPYAHVKARSLAGLEEASLNSPNRRRLRNKVAALVSCQHFAELSSKVLPYTV